MSHFNRSDRTPITPSTKLNYSIMDHKLSYSNVSIYTQDFLKMQKLLRDSSDILDTSNPQTGESTTNN